MRVLRKRPRRNERRDDHERKHMGSDHVSHAPPLRDRRMDRLHAFGRVIGTPFLEQTRDIAGDRLE
jgi:hypothetical protein